MRLLAILLFLSACSQLEQKFKERPLQENQLVQCYMESDTYKNKDSFAAKLNMFVSEMGTVIEAKVVSSTPKDPNLNTCLTYVMLGAGRSLKTKEKPGIRVKQLKFTPEGKHEL